MYMDEQRITLAGRVIVRIHQKAMYGYARRDAANSGFRRAVGEILPRFIGKSVSRLPFATAQRSRVDIRWLGKLSRRAANVPLWQG